VASCPPDDPRSILVIKLSSIGDLLLFTPALHFLRISWPDAKITLLTESRCVPVIRNNPDHDRVIAFPGEDAQALLPWHPFRVWKQVRRTLVQLREEEFDLALDFQGLFKSWYFFRRVRAGFRAGKGRFPGVDLRSPHRKRVLRHAVVSYFELTDLLGIARPNEEGMALRYSPGASYPPPLTDGSYVLCNPFTLWESKKWPEMHWIALGRLLEQEGLKVIFTGAAGDRTASERMAAAVSADAVSLAGEVDLDGLAAAVSHASCLVSVDSAPMHMGAALGVRLVALFGPTDPLRTGPWAEHALVLSGRCWRLHCRRRACRSRRCLTELHPEIVAAAVQKVINRETDVSG